MNADPVAAEAADGPSDDLTRELAPYIGRSGPWRWSRTAINQAEIWNFCEAVEDSNPVYWDEETAKASRFGRLIAPPQALLSFMMGRSWAPAYVREREHEDLTAQGSDPEDRVRDILTSHGFGTATAVTRKEEYLEPFGPGDGRIRQAVRVVDVSPVKQTKVGPGLFVTTTVDYRTEYPDRLVARATLVVLRYDGRGAR